MWTNKSLRLSESPVHYTEQLFRFIVLHFSIDVHSHFAVLVPRQILHCFGINGGIDQVGDVSMAQLVWRHFEIQAIHHPPIMPCLLPQNRRNGMGDFWPFIYLT